MDAEPGNGPQQPDGADPAGTPTGEAGGAGEANGADGAGEAAGTGGSTGRDEAGGTEGAEEREPPEGSDPLKFSKWMKRSATGAVMTGISIGLREALQTTKKEPAFMIEASGQPEDADNPIQLHFDPDNPADTVAVIRQPKEKDGPTGPVPG